MVGVRRIRAIARREAKDVLSDQAEDKYYDAPALNNTILNTATQGMAVSQMGQNTTASGRLGISILCKYVTIRWYAQLNPAATNGQALRMILYMDTAQSGAPPSVISFPDSLLRPLAAIPTTSQRNPEATTRYMILWDKTIVLLPNGGNVKVGRKTIRLFNRTHYLGQTNTNADAGPNALYVAAFSNDAVAGPSLNLVTRLRFEDA